MTPLEWIAEIEKAQKHEKQWRSDAKSTIRRFRREQDETIGRNTSSIVTPGRSKFDILYANTQTLLPAMYSSTPKPNVDSRYKEADPVSQQASEVLERALDYSIDSYDFDSEAQRAMMDYLLPGRGVERVRYIPTFTPTRTPVTPVETDKTTRFIVEGPEIEEIEHDEVETDENGHYVMRDTLSYEEVRCEYVHWEDFIIQPARAWAEVKWIAFRHLMTRDEMTEQFGEKGKDVPLQYSNMPETEAIRPVDEDSKKRGEVFEIWDREDEKIIVIAKGYTDSPLMEEEDPLKLVGFFPIPEPVYSIKTNGTMIPKPEFMIYKDQADELDEITGRIGAMIRALKANGFYASSFKDFVTQLENSDDDEYIPVDGWQALQDKGGLSGLISYFPIEERSSVLQVLYAKRSELIDTIYQITGIGDIMRGMGDPRETKGAQELKAQFGSRRLFPRQQDCERFFREILRLKAEIIAKHFSPKTLQLMTGVQITPEIMQLLRNDAMRCFKIEIQTDSMIAPDAQQDKQDVSEFFASLGSMMQAAGPMVQSGAMSQQAFKALVLAGARRFRFTREVEQELNAPAPPPPQPQPDPSVQVAQIKAQSDQQIAGMKLQADMKQHMDDHMRKAGIDAASTVTDRQHAMLQFIAQIVAAELAAKADAVSTAADVHSAELDFQAAMSAPSTPQ